MACCTDCGDEPCSCSAAPGQPLLAPRQQRLISVQAARAAFSKHFQEHCAESLRQLLWRADETAHFGLAACFVSLLREQPALANALLDEPLVFAAQADDGARDAQQALLASNGVGPRPPGAAAAAPSLKPLCRARFSLHPLALPGLPWLRADSLRERHVGRLVVLQGTVARVGPPRLREAARGFVCARCGFGFGLPLDAESGEVAAALPQSCPSPRGCPSASFKPAASAAGAQPTSALCVDTQELLLQPLRRGACAAAGVTAVVEADLLQQAAVAGEEFLFCGVVRRRWAASGGGAAAASLLFGRMGAELVLHTHSVQPLRRPPPSESAAAAAPRALAASDALEEWRPFWSRYSDAPLAGRETLLRAVCPQISGLRNAKLALLLSLCGGVSDARAGGGRGESHLLLLGVRSAPMPHSLAL